MSWEIFIVPGILLAIIIYRVYFVLISSAKLTELIQDYYENDKRQIVLIRKLSLNEKFRYRESTDLAIFISFGTFNSSLFRKPGDTYFRVIELKDTVGNEFQVYTEIQIMNQEIVELIEFDSYEL